MKLVRLAFSIAFSILTIDDNNSLGETNPSPRQKLLPIF